MGSTEQLESLDHRAFAKALARSTVEQGAWTEQAYWALPETRQQVELSDGCLFVTPAPDTAHAQVVIRLLRQLLDYARTDDAPIGEALTAPVAVRLQSGRIRQPDVLFLPAEGGRITRRHLEAPSWVAEIVSPGFRRMDEVKKHAEYAEAGIAEYWLVDPERERVTVLALDEGADRYRDAQVAGPGETARSLVLAGFAVEVDALFAGLAR